MAGQSFRTPHGRDMSVSRAWSCRDTWRLFRESLRQLLEPPTHVFIQSGVGGIAAAVAGHLAVELGARRPTFTVVDPARAACIVETARAGRPVTIAHGEPTVMAMLECNTPSLLAWRILARAADAFMTVDEDDAISAMRQLADPVADDPAIVAGESGGVGPRRVAEGGFRPGDEGCTANRWTLAHLPRQHRRCDRPRQI
ncbi:pyridoxal-phosphate dependent enzyme [Sinorhizobium medicae]|uniref:pyridoxal-phosphate dependent enzyme n=1 Tax=Sinorhizobium medicae TaxID=110321 RepID=UPI003B52853C